MYNTSDPPIIIFYAIEELSSLSKVTNIEKSQQQISNYRLKILTQNGEFEMSRTTWFHKAPAELTWSNFKKYFTDAHTNLMKVRGSSMANKPHKQTNDAINKLTQEFAEIHSEVLGSVKALTNSHEEILTNINQNQDLPPLNSSQICSILNSEQINNINIHNNDLQKLILQL